MSERPENGLPKIGIAYSPRCYEVVGNNPELVDYFEVPFELLERDPSFLGSLYPIPVVLHCASLSMAGSIRAADATIRRVAKWVEATQTPWLGEHLSYVLAARNHAQKTRAATHAEGELYDIGYSISPPLNASTLKQLIAYHVNCETQIGVPIILENPPIYFTLPNSTMTQFEFLRELCRQSSVNLLLDLSHFLITCRNTRCDPLKELLALPIDRIVEVHISGLRRDGGLYWDDHAEQAPDEVYDLLQMLLARTCPRAVTLEYNWSSQFSKDLLVAEIERVRGTIRWAQKMRKNKTIVR